MLNDYFKNKTVKNVTLVFLLAIAIYAFVEWREQRLERRAKMSPQKTQLDLSKVGSEGRIELLIDSHTGKHGFYINVYTPVEVFEKDIIETSKELNKKMYVDIYKKYEKIDKNPDKYKEWKDIELEIFIKRKVDGKIYMVKKCFPYDFSESSKGYYQSRCYLGDIDNGLYLVNIEILKNNIDFKENKSNITIVHGVMSNHADFFSSILDNTLELLSIEEWK